MLFKQLLSIVDVYDALSSDRYYRPAFSHKEAVAILVSEKGESFDPYYLDVWLKMQTSSS